MRKKQSHKSYRSLTVLTFRLSYLLHELRPFGSYECGEYRVAYYCYLLWRRAYRLLLLQFVGGSSKFPVKNSTYAYYERIIC